MRKTLGVLGVLTATCLLSNGQVREGQIEQRDEVATVPDGFVFEEVFSVPKDWGSWVALTALPSEGETVRVAAADQYGDIYEVSIAGKKVAVERLPVDIRGAHGLLWFQDALYVVVNEPAGNDPGVYRATDSDGDGSLETVELLKGFQARGEHGVHSLVPSPDGQWLYMVAGNMSQEEGIEKSLVPKVWGEDHLLPRNPDGRGHASNVMAPAGRVMRFHPDGSNWEYVSVGYRNPFDGAFNEDGEFFVYDADMEWDLGMPWYRPTRLCWALPGSEYGWRNGTGKWPEYYVDSLPSVVDFGPGSPVGVVSGRGAKFPAKYQRAIYCLDWTFATIYAVDIKSEGGGYTGEWEEFLTAKALPLTDAIVGEDGEFYFATGGRRQSSKLWRVRYEGSEPTKDVWQDGEKPAAAEADRWTRFQKRTEAELAGVAAVRDLVGKGDHMDQIIALVGLARVGEESDRETIAEGLLGLPWSEFSKDEKLAWLRAASLFFIRLGEPGESEREQFLALVNDDFPNADDEVEDELLRLLCYLQAPDIVPRTLALMAQPVEKEVPEWARLISRSQGDYGVTAAQVIRELGSPRYVHFAYCLRVVKGPWTEGQRRQLMDWYAREEQGKAVESARLGLARLKQDTLANATEEERQMIESWGLEVKRDPFENLPRAEGPGRNWTVEEIAELAKDLSGANRENGERMFRAALCAACHRYGTQGGAAGPDLTNVAGRFSAEELAVAILEPSREVSDQYEFSLITRHDGSSVVGKMLDERDEILVIAVNPFNFEETIEISRADIKSIEPSPTSPMPGSLVNQFNEKEMRDFLGYLLKK
ncbi:c-type cytochrome [Roseibacillus ishigakijimensis]|uniref:C-type cytochrome n=1 Tax=Roseibacillus ishigakijimensis TaxID=454146 RepID=A0A934VKV1_9BACT|nr:c-type cytochrome [Roseibacillus ishigakijimensis]MBK1832471.1 c-type cytochrome [Roseibacillus ishigakijimensis]